MGKSGTATENTLEDIKEKLQEILDEVRGD